jgi:uncharacterized protein YbjQ (UPF0145 family)
MLLVTTENITGKTLIPVGLVKGGVVQSKHIGKDIAAGFKTLIGGELKSYTEMMNEARALATKRMVDEAEKMNADAIVCIRYVSSAITQGAAEVVAYGTAVKFEHTTQ